MVRIWSKLGGKEYTLREFKIIRPRNLARILELSPILSDFFQIFSDEKEILSDLIWKMSLEIERTTCCFVWNNMLFLLKQAVGFYKQAQITRKRAKILKNAPQFSIFKLSENRIIPSIFFWTRIWALNGGIGNVKMSISQWMKMLRMCGCFLPQSVISS